MAPEIIAELNVARDHFKNNRLAEAESDLSRILTKDSGNPFARTLLAGIRFRSGHLAEADEIAERVLAGHPDHLDALGLLAIVRKAQGRFESAASLFEQILALGNRSADLYSQLGTCRLESGDFVGAGVAFKQAIQLDRTRPDNYYYLGMALKMSGTSYETFMTFKRAVELDPIRFDGYVQLWESMRKLLNWQEGVASMERGLSTHPDSPLMKVMLAITYGKLGKKRETERLFLDVASDPEAALPYAHWLQEEGRFDESIPVLNEVIKAKPVQGQAYYNLSMAKRFDVGGQAFTEQLPALLQDQCLDSEQLMFLHYALAKSHEHDKNYEQAMHHFDLANEKAFDLFILKDGSSEGNDLEALEMVYSKARIEALSSLGSKSKAPLFIVGMIRTGTTLLDQILSSHPSVSSAGEQPFWQISTGRLNNRWLEAEPTAKDFRELESAYLHALHRAVASGAGGEAVRITDKMPTNFWHIGAMTLAFPNAKFIHIRRSPLDTCLSIYTTFLGNGTQFAYNQENIVSYYQAYLRIMEFWRSVLPPGRMMEIDYEELVTDKEAVLRQLLPFIGLGWSDSVLSHEQNRGQVSTPSLWTARQPVNAASVERWRRYEPWLGALLKLRDVKHPPAHLVS